MGSYAFHNYDNNPRATRKKDPRAAPVMSRSQQIEAAIYAAARGDLPNLRIAYLRGVNMNSADYDGRTGFSSFFYTLTTTSLLILFIQAPF